MKPDRIHDLVDQLLARDRCYRPVALLRLCQRLSAERQQRWEQGELAFLEDGLAGNPARSIEVLRVAADWASTLNLRGESEEPTANQGKMFRNASDDRLARMVWYRRDDSPQGNLFFDNRFALARARLSRSLLAGDAGEAEQSLSEMARAEPGNAVQADAEHLVGALGLLSRPVDDPAALLDFLERDLAPRARRFLSAVEGDQYLERFWRFLGLAQKGERFDPERPELHSGAFFERARDWTAVIDSIQAVDDWAEHESLAARLATAALSVGRRETGLVALCQLCWRHSRTAERWLDHCEDDELTRRVERFWDLEEPLDIELFPAWLAMVGYAMPDPEVPEHPAAQALPRMKALRQDPSDSDHREWLQTRHPHLFAYWIERQ